MSVEVIGLKAVLDKIRAIDDDELKRDLAYSYGQELRADVEPYPPATEANRPGGKYSWYQRGYGTKTRTGKGYPTSQDLLNRWKITRTRKGAQVENTARYAEYVHDKDRQAWFHKRRGWRTWQKVADVNQAKYIRNMARTVERHINKA